MKSMDLTRRQFLKGASALIVSFNLLPSLPSVFAQSNLLPNGDLDPAQLDSWLAIAQDGTVTLFTSKVDLGTGILTALAQIAAEELDVSWKQIKVIQGDTALTVDQSATGGAECFSIASRMVRGLPSSACATRSGTTCGGGGGGEPSRLSSIHLPRCTAEVRFG